MAVGVDSPLSIRSSATRQNAYRAVAGTAIRRGRTSEARKNDLDPCRMSFLQADKSLAVGLTLTVEVSFMYDCFMVIPVLASAVGCFRSDVLVQNDVGDSVGLFFMQKMTSLGNDFQFGLL